MTNENEHDKQTKEKPDNHKKASWKIYFVKKEGTYALKTQTPTWHLIMPPHLNKQ